MTAIAELSGALPDLATSGAGFAGWSSSTPTAFERSDGTHGKVDVMPALAFDVPDVAVHVQSPVPQSPVVLEKPAVYSPRVVEALLPPGMAPQRFSEGLDDAVRSKHGGISRAGFEAVWSSGNDQPAITSVDRLWSDFPLPQREVILSAIPDVRPSGQPDWDARWHEKTAHNARSRLALETGHTPDEVTAMTPGSALENQIRGDAHLSKLLAKVERHERYLADAREKQGALDEKWADDQYAVHYRSKMYEPERVAREAAIAANDAKVAHVLYADGKPIPGVPFEGYARPVDVGEKRLTAIHQAFDPRVAQDLALEAEDAVDAARVARTALTKAQIDRNGFGPALMASGMPISAFVYSSFGKIDEVTKGIHNPTVRSAVRKGAKIAVSGGLATLGAIALSGCAAPVTPHAPTLPPPGGEPSVPALSAAQETGAMMAQTVQGRAFYEALTTHGVDASACSPDVLGSLVVEKSLPLETVIGLTTIATDALANTSEPDHLNAMVCDAKAGVNGTQTVVFYFLADQDFTGDGTPDIFIPSQAKVLLPGQLVDGVPEVVTPVVEEQPPAGSPVVAPNWSAAGGEIPAEIRGLMTVEEQSIRDSLAAQGIDPNSVSIHDVFRGSGNDFRMGSGVTNSAQTIAFYPKFDDNTDGFAWRPDLRLVDRPWHWQSVFLPEGVNGKIEVVFDPKSEAPQFVALTPDESHMMGWFNNLTGQWLTKDGNELTQALSSTATLPATIPVPATEAPAPTATPAEIVPTSCKDILSIQPIADKFLQDMNAQHGYKDWGEIIAANGITKDDLKTSFSTQAIIFRQSILVDSYDVPVSIPGFEGKAQCVVFAVPTSTEDVKLLPVIISATRNDGKKSGSMIRDNPSAYGTFLPDDVDKWVKDHKGKAVEIAFYVFGTSVLDITGGVTLDGVDRSILNPFYEYALRIGKSGLTRPDPWQMMGQMNGNEPGLMLKLMLGEPDF